MVRSLFARFGRDRSGVAFIIFAITAAVIIPLAGGALDYGRALTVRERLAAAADAAALALTSRSPDDQQTANQLANALLLAQFPLAERNGTQISSPVVDISEPDHVTITISGSVPSNFLSLLQIRTLPINVRATAVRSNQMLDVVMVLDNTGSMGGSKLVALKRAAKAVTKVLLRDSKPGQSVQIGLVPYSMSVNVGKNRTVSWLDLTGTSEHNTDDIDLQTGTSLFDVHEELQESDWEGCVRARPSPLDVQDSNPFTDPWVALLAPDEHINNYLLAVDKTQKNRSIDRYRGGSVKPRDTSKKRSQDPGPNRGCVEAPIMPLTANADRLDTAIDAMAADGNTFIAVGAVWGLRVLSRAEPFTEAQSDTIGKKVRRAIILLTDGENAPGGYFNAYGRLAKFLPTPERR